MRVPPCPRGCVPGGARHLPMAGIHGHCHCIAILFMIIFVICHYDCLCLRHCPVLDHLHAAGGGVPGQVPAVPQNHPGLHAEEHRHSFTCSRLSTITQLTHVLKYDLK